MNESDRRWPRVSVALSALAAVAVLITLLIGFIRFDERHREFLHENMDSVHGARTLLKARYHLGQAEQLLARAAAAGPAFRGHVREAAAALELAGSYGAEGHDAEPQVRSALAGRITALREAALDVEVGDAPLTALPGLAAAAAAVADDIEAAELERWGHLAALDKALGERLAWLRLAIIGGIAAAALLLAGLAWALRRAARAERAMRAAHAASPEQGKVCSVADGATDPACRAVASA